MDNKINEEKIQEIVLDKIDLAFTIIGEIKLTHEQLNDYVEESKNIESEHERWV